MYEIKLRKGGVEKEFSKEYINVQDNLLALEHNARQIAFIDDKKASSDPNKVRKLNESYLRMFVEMYGKQFTLEELKLADVKTMETLHQLFGDSLNGGKTDEEAEDGDDSKKEK